jgi:threonine synthase
VIRRYREYLPVTAATPLLDLGEGSTPLVRAPRIEEAIGCAELYLKLEGCNPTGSFKDRGMVMAVAKALEEGARTLICASTGNTSAAAAAYAARAGLSAVVLIPDGKIARGKLAQAMIHGATVVALDGNFDEALRIVRLLGQDGSIAIVNSINPYRIEGQKTAAFEVCEQLDGVPDYLAIPVGNAGNITSYWKGFQEWRSAGRANTVPRMLGFQAAGAAPIVRGEVVEHPETIATAIRIGNPASWTGATTARDESGGLIDEVTDSEIIAAYHLLASKEGIFAEPASAASVAGVLKAARSEKVDFRGARVVCVLTGTGLKDPDTAVGQGNEVAHLPADAEQVKRWLSEVNRR